MPDFRINPLQIPDPIRATPLDFSPLADIGNTLALNRKRQAIADTLSQATDAQGNLDLQRAGTELAKIGLFEEARPTLALAAQSAHQKALEDISRGQLGVAQQREAREAEQPMVIPYGAGVMRRSGEILREPSTAGIIDDDTARFAAKQLRAGDTSVLTNWGRGAQGAENLVRIRQEFTRQNMEAGVSPEEQAAKNAEFFGERSMQRALGTRTAQVEVPAREFQNMAPLALQWSEAVDRSKYPSLNSAILAWKKGTGDEATAQFAVGANSLVNIYARAISPTGVATDELRKKGFEILQQGYGKGAFRAAVEAMELEIAAARRAPGEVRQEQRQQFLGGAPAAAPAIAPSAAPARAAPSPMRRSPDARDQQFLRDHPETRDQFDEKFGQGLSDRILGRRLQL